MSVALYELVKIIL